MTEFKNRFEYIGASDFPVIMEKSKWKKRINLVLEKAQVIPMEEVNNSAVVRGSRLEKKVIQEFMNKTGMTVTNFQKEVIREKTKDCIKLLAHLDGEIENTNIPFEAKTTNISKKWETIPEVYQSQLEMQMFLNKSEIAYIAVGYVNSDDDEDICGFDYFEYKKQMTDDEILEHCKKFTKDVEYYKNSFGIVNNGLTVKAEIDSKLIQELEDLNSKISEMKADIKPYEDKKKAIETKLKNLIGCNNSIENDLYRISLGNRITSPSLDYKITRSGIKIEYL